MSARITPDELEARMAENCERVRRDHELQQQIDATRAITPAHVLDAAYAVLGDVAKSPTLFKYPFWVEVTAVRAKLPVTVNGYDALVPPLERLGRMVVDALSGEYAASLAALTDDSAGVLLSGRAKRAPPREALDAVKLL